MENKNEIFSLFALSHKERLVPIAAETIPGIIEEGQIVPGNANGLIVTDWAEDDRNGKINVYVELPEGLTGAIVGPTRELTALDEDRIFVNADGAMRWVYHNPDCNSGDQFVVNDVCEYLLNKAIADTPVTVNGKIDSFRVFDYIAEECKNTCIDVTDRAYENVRTSFTTVKPLATGATAETLETMKTAAAAIEIIQRYTADEFKTTADFSDLENIGLAYSTDGDSTELEVTFNLLKKEIEYLGDGEVLLTETFESDEELLDFLRNMEFSTLIGKAEDLVCS